MINKIELIEKNNSDNNTIIMLDFVFKNLKYIENNLILKNELLNNSSKVEALLKKYILYWDKEYIDNLMIDGKETQLIITTTDEIITYTFKNKYPSNYHEFLKLFKELVGVL